ncbi:MAG: endonuclease/exonuclease/phosphatase family protein [Holophaga sp.]|jgi:hypothetical protein
MNRPILLTCLLALATLGQGLQAQAPDPKRNVRVLSLNCYCFPDRTTQIAKYATRFLDWVGIRKGEVDLASGITKGIPQRIDLIAAYVNKSGAQIACFSELWKFANKKRMMDRLGKGWHFYWNQDKDDITNPAMMDDGLLIASKWPAIETSPNFFQKVSRESGGVSGRAVRWFTYDDREDDEKMAQKGAIIFAFDHNYETMILADTHLQSGTAKSALAVEEKQMQQLAREMDAFASRLRDPMAPTPVVLVGDFNQPITFRKAKGRVYDRVSWMIDRYNAVIQGNPFRAELSLAGRVDDLADARKAGTILEIDELKNQVTTRKPHQSSPAPLAASDPDAKIERFNGGDSGGWDYWMYATDPPGRQVLDDVWVSYKWAKVEDYQVKRKEILGDKVDAAGHGKPYDADTAFSDHAAIMFTVVPTTRKRF